MASTLIDLSPQDVQTQMKAGQAIVVDVREPAEYEDERVPGALLLPLSLFNASQFPTLSGTRIILMCGVGQRSAAAAEKLFAAGHETAYHLKGGLQAWKDADLITQIY